VEASDAQVDGTGIKGGRSPSSGHPGH
jgi:hypothetical protein